MQAIGSLWLDFKPQRGAMTWIKGPLRPMQQHGAVIQSKRCGSFAHRKGHYFALFSASLNHITALGSRFYIYLSCRETNHKKKKIRS